MSNEYEMLLPGFMGQNGMDIQEEDRRRTEPLRNTVAYTACSAPPPKKVTPKYKSS